MMADAQHDILALRAEAEGLKAEAVAVRRDLHAHPELGFQETRTAGIVADKLHGLGLEVQTEVGRTGVVGMLRGAGDGPTAMVRADMDALPMDELSHAPYASRTPGAMHACGHDGHTAIGLSVARMLAARRDTLRGAVKFVFQPAEEILRGAEAMIHDGVLDDPPVDCAFGLHLWTGSPVGTVSTNAGALMAGADSLDIVVKGTGGHAAMPHHTVDSIVVAAHVVSALQTVVSRNVSPLDAAVVSFGQIHGGTAANVLPETVTIAGTIRTFHADVRIEVVKHVRDIAQGVAQSFGADADVTVTPVCEPTVNDTDATSIVLGAAKALLGSSSVLSTSGVMGSEDMSLFLNRVPGCFFFVGAEPASGPTYSHHSPHFDFNEDAMPVAAALMAGSVLRYLDAQA
jgi:amidohydrolase